jgi:hypothetical protein
MQRLDGGEGYGYTVNIRFSIVDRISVSRNLADMLMHLGLGIQNVVGELHLHARNLHNKKLSTYNIGS